MEAKTTTVSHSIPNKMKKKIDDIEPVPCHIIAVVVSHDPISHSAAAHSIDARIIRCHGRCLRVLILLNIPYILQETHLAASRRSSGGMASFRSLSISMMNWVISLPMDIALRQ